MNFIDSNFGNNYNDLYGAYKKRKLNNDTQPNFGENANFQPQMFQQPYQQQGPLGMLFASGLDLIRKGMAKRNDGMYNGVPVGMGDGSDLDRYQQIAGVSQDPEVLSQLSNFMGG